MGRGPFDSARARWLLFGLVALGLGACTPTTDLSPSRVHGYQRVARTQGSSVVVTQDERIAVVCNRIDGVISILRLDPSRPATELVSDKRTDLLIHPLNESQPWVAVIAPDDDTAYVLLRGKRQVVRLVGLHGDDPHLAAEEPFAVGSEPTSLVITPSGKELFVANSADGTVSSIVVAVGQVASWDLNGRLVAEGYLGSLIGTEAAPPAIWTRKELDRSLRPGLAHPRALAITDDGDADDDDEMLYATEFFGQPLPKGGPSNEDNSHVGVVYPILLTGQAPPDQNVIQLDPVGVSFLDAEGNATACYPNQLYSAATSGNRLYVTAVCASPSGPIEPGVPGTPSVNNNFKTVVHSVVFTVDTTKNAPIKPPLVLTDALSGAFASDAKVASTDMAPLDLVRMPLIPVEINVAAPDADGNRPALLSALGSSAVYPITFAADGTSTVGVAGHRYIRFGDNSMPTGVAVLSGNRALVADEHAALVGVTDLATNRVVTAVGAPTDDWQAAAENDPAEIVSDDARDGRQLFSTGLKGWSFLGQSWSSCESCHPEGLSDGVTWRFTRGPRRSISLAGTYFRDDPTRRILLWGANVDELHDVEAIARRVSGGAGGAVWKAYANPTGKDCRLLYDGTAVAPVGDAPQCAGAVPTTSRANGLNGSLAALSPKSRGEHCSDGSTICDINASTDWDKIDAFARTVKAPHRPTQRDEEMIKKGADLFVEQHCNACHGGAGWTLSRLFYEPGGEANGLVPFVKPKVEEVMADAAGKLPVLRGSLRTLVFKVPEDAPKPFGAGTWSFRNSPDDVALGDKETPVVHELAQLYGPPDDRLRCALRNVGTYGQHASDPEAPPVDETKHLVGKDPDDPMMMKMKYLDLPASSKDGFNIPSLVGLSAGAPYFHAGNARTLEEVFDPAFAAHLYPGAPPLSSEDVRNLVSYLLSLDETGDTPPPPLANVPFDPDLCGQFLRDPKQAPPLALACDPTQNGVCQNHTDCALVTDGRARLTAQSCSQTCLASSGTCTRDCVVQQLGMTADCAQCYADRVACMLMNCLGECVADPESEKCQQCDIDKGCRPNFDACSGLPPG